MSQVHLQDDAQTLLLRDRIRPALALCLPRQMARPRLRPGEARRPNEIFFSSISIAEIAIKHVKNPELMPVTPEEVRDAALEDNLHELNFESVHAVALAGLPLLHKDPFDRMLIAQAEGSQMKLMTHDDFVARYPVALGV